MLLICRCFCGVRFSERTSASAMMILTPPGAGKILLNLYQPAPRGRPASEASAADLGGELLAGNGKTSFE